MASYEYHTALQEALGIVDRLKDDPEARSSWDFTIHLKQQPEQLPKVPSWLQPRLYRAWAVKLFEHGQALMAYADGLLDQARRTSVSPFSCRSPLDTLLSETFHLMSVASVFRKEVGECQNHLLGSGLDAREGDIAALAEMVDNLDERIKLTIDTINSKRWEATTTRLTYASLLLSFTNVILSIAAVAVSLLSYFK